MITADNLRAIRIAYGLTQDELGLIANVTAGMINKIERGKYPLTDAIKDRLERELAMTAEKLTELLAEYDRMMAIKLAVKPLSRRRSAATAAAI